jgi:hypothetical protein
VLSLTFCHWTCLLRENHNSLSQSKCRNSLLQQKLFFQTLDVCHISHTVDQEITFHGRWESGLNAGGVQKADFKNFAKNPQCFIKLSDPDPRDPGSLFCICNLRRLWWIRFICLSENIVLSFVRKNKLFWLETFKRSVFCYADIESNLCMWYFLNCAVWRSKFSYLFYETICVS